MSLDLARATARAKRACADKGYVADAFAPMFATPDAGSGDPLLRRGYYARHRAVDLALRAFLALHADAQVVVLGGGLDATFFRLHATGATVPYFEADSEEVVAEKQRIIRQHPALLKAVGPLAAGAAGAKGPLGPYHVLAADLRDAAATAAALAAAGVKPHKPTLVLAECVLAYLEPAQGDALVAWARATFADCFFVAYDVVESASPFCAVMKRNFRARGCPLLGANASLAAAEARCGAFATKSALSMREVYRRVVLGQPEEFRRVAALEIFDDPDQFDLMMGHYCFVLAGQGSCLDLPGVTFAPATGVAR